MSLASLPRVGHPKHAQSTCELETQLGRPLNIFPAAGLLYLILSYLLYLIFTLTSCALGHLDEAGSPELRHSSMPAPRRSHAEMQSIEGLYSVGRTPKSVDERVLSNRPRKVHIVIRLWTSGSASPRAARRTAAAAAHCCSRCAPAPPARCSPGRAAQAKASGRTSRRPPLKSESFRS